MQTVLNNLNAVPGVVGTLVCAPDGQLLANAFPPIFEETALADVARAVAEGAAGLAPLTGEVRTLDLRHANARVVARRLNGATLLFLCAPTMNLQLLDISVSVAAPRVEKALAGRPADAAASGRATAGELHALVQRIDRMVERKRLDPFATRGEIAVRAGFGLGFIDADTPDDPEKLSRLRAAAAEVLGEVP